MILWPTFEVIPRVNGSIFMKKDVLQSTATELGEIEVQGNLSDEEQLQEVRDRESRWRATLEEQHSFAEFCEAVTLLILPIDSWAQAGLPTMLSGEQSQQS